MTTPPYEQASTESQVVARLDGTPRRKDDSPLSRRELFAFNAIRQIIVEKIGESAQLGEEYLRAKVAQETNSATKTAQEAAELASRREINEAEADIKRQDATERFIKNLERVGHLAPPQQMLALAKMIQNDPELGEQVEKIESLLDGLRVVHGTQVGFLNGLDRDSVRVADE